MNPHGPHDQRGTAHWGTDNAAMNTFTGRLPRWPVLLRGRVAAILIGTHAPIGSRHWSWCCGCLGGVRAACHPDRGRRGHRGLLLPPPGLRRACRHSPHRARDGHLERPACPNNSWNRHHHRSRRDGRPTAPNTPARGRGAIDSQTGDRPDLGVSHHNGAKVPAPTPATENQVQGHQSPGLVREPSHRCADRTPRAGVTSFRLSIAPRPGAGVFGAVGGPLRRQG